jgi:SSS family solute:Na+ symporter
MHLSFFDWLIVCAYLGMTIVVGIIFSRKGTKSVDSFFVANRSLPWWLAGITMSASAFSIDTPIGITGLVAKDGIPGMWYAWVFVLGGAGALGAFIFASFLRRSEVITFAELVELRYSGKEAAFLRGFKGVYFGIFANAVTVGYIIKAVMTISHDVLGFNPHITLLVILGFTLFYSAISGMWGIVANEFIQFIIGFIGMIVLTIFAWSYIGGIKPVVAGFVKRYGESAAAERLSFFPAVGSPFFITFMVFIIFRWWNAPPPAIHQRIVASKNEKHASFSTLLFSVVSFGINYWPMIMIAVVSLVAFPTLAEPERGYGMLMVKLLPTGVIGLMVAAILATFMSTIDTHINYGAAFMINDLYRRFINKNADQKHYVRASQIGTALMLGIAVVVAYMLDSVQQAWYYLAMLTAGYGFLIVMRWFWWRINAWAEIAALSASGIGSTLLSSKFAKAFGYYDVIKPLGFGWSFIIIVCFCSLAWITVTIFTKPSDEKKLVEFCRKVKPYPRFWGPIYKKYPDIEWNPNALRDILHWFFGVIAIFCACFGIGSLIFKSTVSGIILLIIAVILFAGIYFTWEDRKEKKAGRKKRASDKNV